MTFTKLEIKSELNKLIAIFYKPFKFCHRGNNYDDDKIYRIISFKVVNSVKLLIVKF